MKKFTLRFNVEEYEHLAKKAGLIPLNSYIKEVLFKKTVTASDGTMNEWIELLNQVEDRAEIYKNMADFAEKYDTSVVDVFKKRIR